MDILGCEEAFWCVTNCFRLHVLAAAFVLIIDCGNTLQLKSCTSVPTRSVDVHCYVSTPFCSFIMHVAASAGAHPVSRVLCNICCGLEAGAPEASEYERAREQLSGFTPLLSALVAGGIDKPRERHECDALLSQELCMSGSLSTSALQSNRSVCSLLMDKPHLQYRF